MFQTGESLAKRNLAALGGGSDDAMGPPPAKRPRLPGTTAAELAAMAGEAGLPDNDDPEDDQVRAACVCVCFLLPPRWWPFTSFHKQCSTTATR